MSPKRRLMLHAAAAAAVAPATVHRAAAQGAAAPWPRGPVRMVVPFAPGGGTDHATRLLAERLRAMWKVPVVVENKTGGNTIIATTDVLNAPRDGSVLLATIPLTLQLPFLSRNLAFKPMTDLVPLSPVYLEQLVLVVNASSSVKTLADQLKAVAAQRGGLAYGSYGMGTNSHLLSIELGKAAGADIIHVPYRGAALSTQAVLSGEVAMTLTNYNLVKQHFDAGKLVPLAVTGERRSRALPQVPTLAEQGIRGFEIPSWLGIFAAAGVPSSTTARIAADIQAALQTTELQAKIHEAGQEIGAMGPEEFRTLIRRDNDNAERMIRAAGVRLD